MANEQNLRPPFTPKEAREIGRLGGLASAKVRRRNKKMKQVYLDFLAESFCVDVETGTGKRGKKQKVMTGEQLVKYGIQKAISRGSKEALRLAKELREGIDGKPRKQIDINKLLD